MYSSLTVPLGTVGIRRQSPTRLGGWTENADLDLGIITLSKTEEMCGLSPQVLSCVFSVSEPGIR